MGVIQKQGIRNTAFYYLGVALGYINLAVLMTELLTVEQYGLRTVLFQLGSLFSVLSLLGTPNILNRYFPYFRNKENGHNGVVGFTLLYALAGSLLVSLLLIAFKPLVVNYYQKDAMLLVEYYYYIIPFGATLALYEGFSAYSRVLLKSTFPVFIKEFIVRVIHTLALGALSFDYIGFEEFILIYLFTYTASLVVLVITIASWGELCPSKIFNFSGLTKLKEMIVFGSYTLLNASMNIVVKTTDLMMITAYFGLSAGGVYGFGTLVGNVIIIPSNGLKQIAAPVIADAFKRNDLALIHRVYQKTALTQVVSGLFFFGLIIGSLDILLLKMNPEYLESKYVVYFIGLARLVEMASGINNRIIMDSPYYRTSVFFNIVLVVMVVISNLVFIPLYGIIGAAFASALSILIIITIKILFVRAKYKFNPYSSGMVKVLGISLLALAAIWWLPETPYWWLSIGIRSFLFSLIFLPLVIKLKISDDINDLWQKMANRFLKF